MDLLAAGDERLAERAADRLAADEAQVAGASGETEQLVWIRPTEPLEGERELRRSAVEIFARGWDGKKRAGAGRWGWRRGLREALAVGGAEPAVGAPDLVTGGEGADAE